MRKITLPLEVIVGYCQQFLLAICAAIIVLTVYHHSSHKSRVVFVDIAKITKNYLTKIANQQLSEEQSKEEVKRFVSKTEGLLKQLSSNNRWIILPKEAVIEGAEDFSHAIEAELESLD
jgi:hypothetical protein